LPRRFGGFVLTGERGRGEIIRPTDIVESVVNAHADLYVKHGEEARCHVTGASDPSYSTPTPRPAGKERV
jgi:hypothetical protein